MARAFWRRDGSNAHPTLASPISDSTWTRCGRPRGRPQHLDWPDFGVPSDLAVADEQIMDAWRRARAGNMVEVACIGGHGRTGTVLACMAVLAGVAPTDAVPWVRNNYCQRAVQEPSQAYWMERFAERQRPAAS